MVERFYVEDLLSGDSTTNKMYDLYSKAKVRIANGGFKLRKWKTNDPKLKERINLIETTETKQEMVKRLDDEETYAKSTLQSQGGSKGEKVLCVVWNCESDTYHLSLAHITKKAEGLEPTKHNVLSVLASLFDPLGLIIPVTVSMKILFQEICSSKFDWDETLTEKMKGRWRRCLEDLLLMRKMETSRCLYEARKECVTECYSHGFGDASKKVYCAMVYFVYCTNDGQTQAFFC